MELPGGERNMTLLIISQQWLRQWIGAIRQQTFT